jgi:protein SCO1/2
MTARAAHATDARTPDETRDATPDATVPRASRDTRAYRLRFALAIAGLFVAVALFTIAEARRAGHDLPVYTRVPAMRLVDERGAPFDENAMLGHVSVVDFIFTHCASSCPRLTATMADLQARLARDGSRAKLVSFSVDPDNDTPAVLAQYAEKAHADLARWSFVTGPPNDVMRAVLDGFKVSAQKVARGANDFDVVHGDWFVLVDPQGRVRGYYATDDAESLATLLRDIARLSR